MQDRVASESDSFHLEMSMPFFSPFFFPLQDSEKLTSSRPRQRHRVSLHGLCPATSLARNKASAVAR